jgi:uncharacterized membrane protein YesL
MMVAKNKRSDRSNTIEWMEAFNTVTIFVLFNILWLFGSLLIVTIPAVTAALFASVGPWTRRQSPHKPLASFFKAAWRYGLKAAVVVIIDLIALTLVVLNLLILRQMGTDHLMGVLASIVTSTVAVLLVLANVYVWPLLVTLDPPLKDLLKSSIRLGIIHPFWGLAVAILAVIPLVVSLFLPGFFLLTITFAAPALIIHWGAWHIIRRYLTEKELQDLGVNL